MTEWPAHQICPKRILGIPAADEASHPNASPAAVKAAPQAAGTTDWNNIDDRDGIKEKLLNVATF